MPKNRRTEHNGPKNGFKSYWGRRAEAKQVSKKRRRRNGERIVAAALLNEPLMAMVEASAADALANGTDHWPTLEQLEREFLPPDPAQ